jgi:GNAT superfamily N-acetyltransferase
MVWRLRRKDWESGKGERNKRALRSLVASGKRPGILAYDERDAVGWCAIAPREDYPVLARSRVLKSVDDQSVWSVSCLFVLKPYRRRGLSVRLLGEAVAFASGRGARIVEGYPVQPTMEKTPDPFIWTGTPSAFRRAGFEEVLRRSKTRPIMRYLIGSSKNNRLSIPAGRTGKDLSQ